MDFETSVSIDAPIERVWAVLTDVERMPEWTPTMTKVESVDDVGWSLGSRYRIKQPGLAPATWTITVNEPVGRFSWATTQLGVTTTGDHRLAIDPDGPITVTLGIFQTGPLAPVVGRLLGRRIRRYIATEAQGLKHRSESRVSTE